MVGRMSLDVHVITLIDMRNYSSGSAIIPAAVKNGERVRTAVNTIVDDDFRGMKIRGRVIVSAYSNCPCENVETGLRGNKNSRSRVVAIPLVGFYDIEFDGVIRSQTCVGKCCG